MSTLSVIIITKNESANIESCIETVSWADEIICMDSGSGDDTVIRARKMGAKVFENVDYGKQRQIAQQYATSDWILMLDADERVTEALARSIQSVVTNDDRNKAFAMPRLSWCFGRFIRHGGWYPDYVRRLYPGTKGRYSDDLVHEKLIVNDDVSFVSFEKLSGDLIHYTYNNMNHYLVKSANYAAQWSAQRKGQKNKASLFKGFTHALACFLRMYIFRAGFLDGRQGLLLALLSAHSTFVKYADLWVRFYGQKN